MRCNHACAATVMFLALALAPGATAQDFAQIRTMSGGVADRMKQSGRKTVAVVDFTDLQGSVTELGRFLAEEFSVALASSDGIETIDRTHLKALMAEHKLSTSGIIDPQTARKLGQVAGVETLLTGTLTPFGDSVRVALKLLDTNTARVVTASSADIPRTKAIDELLGRSLAATTAVPRTPEAGVSGRSQQSTTSGRPPSVSRVTVGGFTFDMEGCRGSAPVTCQLTVVAADDSVIYLEGNNPEFSRAVDGEGNELRMQQIMFGNRESTASLVANVRTRITAAFTYNFFGARRVERASTNAVTSLSLIELKFRNSSSSFSVQFRNVPVQ